MTAITAAIFAVDASAANSLTTIPTTGTSPSLKVDFSTQTGVQNVANVPLTNILYVTGSSAASSFLPATLTSLAKSGSVIYKYQNKANDIFTYIFTAGVDGVKAGLLVGQTYVIHQRTRDGSLTAALIAAVATPDKAVGVTFNSLAGFATDADKYNCTSQAALTTTSAPLLVTCTTTTAEEKLIVAPATAGKPGQSTVLGLADVDAAQFASELNGANKANGLLNTGTIAAPKGAAAMGSTPIAAQIFGIAANLKLYKAMQTAQLASGSLSPNCTVGDETEACMPGFTSEQITSIFAKGRFNDWTNLSYGVGNLVTANPGILTPKNTAVHICSRASGSGTLASLQSVFENAPCSVNEAIQAATTTTVYPAASNVVGVELPKASQKVYHSTVGSGDLESCLASFNGDKVVGGAVSPSDTGIVGNGNFGTGTGTNVIKLSPDTSKEDFRWALGILNADRNGNKTLPYRFVKIDGYAPSLVNTANGKYRFWSELSYITSSKQGTALTGVAAALVKGMSLPAIIAKGNKTSATWTTTAANASGYNASGYLATAGQAISGVTAFDPKLPVMPFTHADGADKPGSVNHCRAPAILSGNKTLPGLN